ncbi:mfs monosaccharide transporter protein [Penicillium malachiteum]|uniref:mfs monosaccharide transporter protein n=1 Tax=Penicillium malachiteum TaxID=1324776 RepID=UPI002549B5E3|nr:mfs monosaccharide transporter protein [Penicillium malachiteum]KAJ5729973.1 mfs monosaccharide transporter protein [Penicillium malachiteum]
MDMPSSYPDGCPQPQKVTAKMFFLTICVSSAAWIADFDNGYAGTVLIMPSYQKAFGHCSHVPDPATGATIESCVLTTLQQSLVGLGILFMAVGGALAGLFGAMLGRRATLQIACLFCIIEAAGMLGRSGNFLNYMICKRINGVGIGQLIASSIVYGSECVIASKRGLLLGIFNIGLAMGNVTAGAVCAGSATLSPDSDWQWKTPIICQIPLGVILGLGVMLFPESPHPQSLEITAQVNDIKRHLDFERTLDASLILGGLAITGIQFVAPFAALFLEDVGIENPTSQTVVVVFLCIWAFVFGGFIGPRVWISSAEMHSVRMRTYGQANTTFIYEVFSFGATFWTPYMLNVHYGNMGSNVGYFYFGVTVVILILVFLFVPETSRLTLEQIDDYFLTGKKAWSTSVKINLLISQGQCPDSPESEQEALVTERAHQSSATQQMESSINSTWEREILRQI